MISFSYRGGTVHLKDKSVIGVHLAGSYWAKRIEYTTATIYTESRDFQAAIECDDIQELLRKVDDVKVKAENTYPRLDDSGVGQVLEDGEPQATEADRKVVHTPW